MRAWTPVDRHRPAPRVRDRRGDPDRDPGSQRDLRDRPGARPTAARSRSRASSATPCGLRRDRRCWSRSGSGVVVARVGAGLHDPQVRRGGVPRLPRHPRHPAPPRLPGRRADRGAACSPAAAARPAGVRRRRLEPEGVHDLRRAAAAVRRPRAPGTSSCRCSCSGCSPRPSASTTDSLWAVAAARVRGWFTRQPEARRDAGRRRRCLDDRARRGPGRGRAAALTASVSATGARSCRAGRARTPAGRCGA